MAEAGIAPDIVCGTSIGAFVGAAYIAGCLPELRRWAEIVTWREIVALMDVGLSGGGLISFLRGLGVDGSIESSNKRYVAVAIDLANGRETWLESGPILEAVRASIALPGILSPASVNGKQLVDGALSNQCRFQCVAASEPK